MNLGFPWWIRLLHAFNFLFMTLMMRSGIEILSNHPKLYWNEHCRTGSEWLRFTRKRFSDDRMFASTDEEESFSPIIALPGHNELGLGRYWHFVVALGWMTCGMLYVTLMLTSEQWRRLIPTSPHIFVDAYHAAGAYLQLHPPEPGNSFDPQHPYNALQQLTYAAVVFILTPLQIYTGIAMSPAVSNHFLWPDRLLGGRQAVRSLHFLGLAGFLFFLITHVAMVVWHGTGHELAKIILGDSTGARAGEACVWGLAILVAVIAVNVLATVVSLRRGRATHAVLARLWDPVRTVFLHGLRARPTRPATAITSIHHMNGYPPIDLHPAAHDDTHTYERLMLNQFADYTLEVSGLVEQPLHLSLDDLRALPYHSSVQTHMCIQGWSGVAKWGGVRLSTILEMCKPLATARYLAFISYQKHEKAYEMLHRSEPYYECIDLALAQHDESFLAIDMNDKPLPIRHGAPVRLRLGSTLGFKMVKYIQRIVLIAHTADIGAGRGGCREDILYFDMGAEI